jgi:hypothetical protein
MFQGTPKHFRTDNIHSTVVPPECARGIVQVCCVLSRSDKAKVNSEKYQEPDKLPLRNRNITKFIIFTYHSEQQQV